NEKKLADTQLQLAKAREEAADRELKAREKVDAALAKLTAENTAIEISMSGTKRDALIADINARFAAEIQQMTRRGELTDATQAEAERKRDQLVQRELADYDRINSTSRASLEQRAEYEKATYEAMAARSSQFSAETVAAQKEKWLSAEDDVRNWRQVQAQEFTKGREDVKKYQSEWDAAFSAMNESVDATLKRVTTLNERLSQSFTTDLPDLKGSALENVISRFHQAGDTSSSQSLERALSILSSMEGNFAPKTNDEFFQFQNDMTLLAQLRKLKGTGAIPGFAGGVENFEGGLAYVHKNEMLVNLPKGTSVIPASRAGGGPTFNVTIMANSQREGQDAGQGFVKYLRSIGQLLPAGVGN
ncbi:MAG TPA: hypothetical protein VF422_11355, partial [Dokdonella sp.]